MKRIEEGSRGCVVCVLSELCARQPGIRGSPAGEARDLLISRPSKQTLGPTQLAIQWIQWGAVGGWGADDDQSLPSSSETKNKWRYGFHDIKVIESS
jgi:hypothetical protein